MKLKAVKGDHIVELHIGTTAIGRGPLLKIRSTLVSRNHGELELTTDGALTLRAVHKDLSCFYRKASSGEEVLRPGHSISLHGGDIISLLPNNDECAFLVVCDAPAAPSPSIERLPEPPFAVVSVPPTICASSSCNNDVALQTKQASPRWSPQRESADSAPETAPLKKKRTLPEWMVLNVATSSTDGTTSIAKTSARNTGGNKARSRIDRGDKSRDGHNVPDGLASTVTYPGASGKIPESDCVEGRSNGAAEKAPIKLPTENSFSSDDEENVRKPSKRQKKSWLLLDEQSSQGEQKQPSTTSRPPADEGEDDCAGGRLAVLASPPAAAPASVSRQSCIYGTGCYRRNPIHFREFAHPGDVDYEQPMRGAAHSAAAKTRAAYRDRRTGTSRVRVADGNSSSSECDAQSAGDDPDWHAEGSDNDN